MTFGLKSIFERDARHDGVRGLLPIVAVPWGYVFVNYKYKPAAS